MRAAHGSSGEENSGSREDAAAPAREAFDR